MRILNALPVPKLIPKGTRLAYVERLGLVDKITELPSTIFKANSESHENCSRKRVKFVRLFDLSDSTFSDSQKQELLSLLWEFSDTFSKKGDKLGCTDVLDFGITLKNDAKPDHTKAIRNSEKRLHTK